MVKEQVRFFSILPFIDPNINMQGFLSIIPILCFSFLGFDAVTTLSEETKNPRKSIPRAIYLVTIIGGLYYFIGSYFLQLVWPDYQSFKAPESAYMEIAMYIGVTFLISFMLAEGIMSSFFISYCVRNKCFTYFHMQWDVNVYFLPKYLDIFLLNIVHLLFNILIIGGVALSALILKSYDCRISNKFWCIICFYLR
ncbi:amino acid permease [Peribacillus frigoritolerans]|nr:amino acid permease [Peribacillus frigoritolerans]